ncbi:DeoR/GlpR family DNA-binding transcription regulator [Micromonospora pallida]|uniref:DeoR/GlpR family DNA-binding transcription regulator n=1 Tax=Micromonospora pallida TaxID=145854 RepID=UPI00159F2F4F|nr:DeoR/GlpR family DNA-binding transcription regulator [Micromonospora pallida]
MGENNQTRRRRRILELLKEHGRLEVVALSQQLGVTELTVRRDIEYLDSAGVARRVFGGVEVNSGRSFEPPFAFRLETNRAGKEAIARAVVDRISRGSNVAIDFGTKTYFVAQEIRRRRLQILAAPTSMQVADVLGQDPDIHVLWPGGELKPIELSLFGSVTERFFRERRWDVAVVGVAGVNIEQDAFSDYSQTDAHVKAAMVEAADTVVLLAESRHLDAPSFAPVCRLASADVVVTDATGPHKVLDALERKGIEVVRATE